MVTTFTVVLAFGVAASQVIVAQNQARLDKLDAKATAAQTTYEKLRYQVAELESPERVVAAAKDRLGMIEPGARHLCRTPRRSDFAHRRDGCLGIGLSKRQSRTGLEMTTLVATRRRQPVVSDRAIRRYQPAETMPSTARFITVAAVLLLVLAVVVGKLVYVQAMQHDRFEALSVKQTRRTVHLAAARQHSRP